MEYTENHIFGKRGTELLENKIIASGSGFLSPQYRETFELSDLLPDWSVIKSSNRIKLLPMMMISLLLVILFLCSASQHEWFPGWATLAIAILMILSLFTTLIIVFRRETWYLFKYKSGAHAFMLGKGASGEMGMSEFAQRLHVAIARAQQDDSEGTPLRGAPDL